ncbi:hypothetical protein [Sphingobacterium sp. IITKGP-BTPF85]|uniref:hypothetical protein n=1 Tax=Sphingobacterium sp. IITKGP-BTPF85 TaxID=1338009 RepID=UPI00038A3F34|nr:hypothetical protein [Sphingobacterium sp. IITKGP-BTPF85]KKX47283.1 hypothetical protein L950_0227295 [Sphingobacterium sp. IITKGP-BTPF85]
MNTQQLLQYKNEIGDLNFYEEIQRYHLSEFDEKSKNILDTLLYLVNEDDKQFGNAQSTFFKVITKLLRNIIENNRIDELTKLIQKNATGNHINISSLIGRFILNIEDDIFNLVHHSYKQYVKTNLIYLNIKFLEGLISEKAKYSVIVSVFYNCIEGLGQDRKIILDHEATSIFKKYIEKDPTDYLEHFIRPYYSGPTKEWPEFYLHVSEPFCEQIFGNKEKFIGYLDQLSKSDLINDVNNFYQKANRHPSNEDKVVMLFSIDNKHSQNRENHLRMDSDKHIWVKPSCLPPAYKD